MNYIHKLQADLQHEQAEYYAMKERVNELRRHIDLPKYQGVDLKGERNDWMAIADVARWANYIIFGDNEQ